MVCPFDVKEAVPYLCNISLALPEPYNNKSSHSIEITVDGIAEDITILGNKWSHEITFDQPGYSEVIAKEKYFNTFSKKKVVVISSKFQCLFK